MYLLHYVSIIDLENIGGNRNLRLLTTNSLAIDCLLNDDNRIYVTER